MTSGNSDYGVEENIFTVVRELHFQGQYFPLSSVQNLKKSFVHAL